MRVHRGQWCPSLDLAVPLRTVAEMDTMSTQAEATMEVQDDASSDGSAPEWTPRDSSQERTSKQEKKVHGSYAEQQPPWVKMSDCGSEGQSAQDEASLSQDQWMSLKTPRGALQRPAVPRLSMPQMFDIFTERESRHRPPTSPELYHSPPYPEHPPSGPVDDDLSATCSSAGVPSVAGDLLRHGIPGSIASPRLDDARREVAEAHIELLARAAELRKREKRLKRLERQGGADKENLGAGHAAPSNALFGSISPRSSTLDSVRKASTVPSINTRSRSGAMHGSGPLPTMRAKTCSPRGSSGGSRAERAARRVIDYSPREVRTPREHRSSHEFRELRFRRSEPAVACVEDDARRAERRIRKEIRLERRLRRRAEEAATNVWRNSLLMALAASLAVAGVTALFVVVAIRR